MKLSPSGTRAFSCALASFLAFHSLSLALPVDILPQGKYPVATSNLEVRTPEQGVMQDYLIGSIQAQNQRFYLRDLLLKPDQALVVDVVVPDDPAFYGPQAGKTLTVVGYLAYPTVPENPRSNYVFPYTNTADNVFPHMDGATQDPLPAENSSPNADENTTPETPVPVIPNPMVAESFRQWPLIIHSHGYTAHGLWDLDLMKYYASHGYLALSIFHGDGRVEWNSRAQLRPLVVKAFLDYLLAHPVYGPLVDPDRIGISGSSFGGYTSLALLGGNFNNQEATVHDERIRCGFGIVPWLGGHQDMPFGSDFASLEAVTAPYLAVIGANDDVATPAVILEGLKRTAGVTLAWSLEGEGHLFSAEAFKDTRTLAILFFDTFLKDSGTTLQALMGVTEVAGGVKDTKVLQRLPRDAEAGQSKPLPQP
jgi:hypothetical protein